MPRKPVNTAIKVILGPCLDDTDMKTREEALAYNQAGMEIDVILEKNDGTVTTTAVTPTTSGVYDWVHTDQGNYELELPASGGVSFNNDTEGILTVVGYCTGVLPFHSVAYDIVPFPVSPPKSYGIAKDATSQMVRALLTDLNGSPKTGLANTDVTSWYWLQDGDSAETSAVAVNAGTLGTFGGDDGDAAFVEVDATNNPGEYELSLPNNANVTGADRCVHTLVIDGAGLLELVVELLDPLSVTSAGVVKSDLTTILTEAHPAERLKAATDLMLAFTVQASPTPTTTSCGTDLDSGVYSLDTLADIIEGATIIFASGGLIYGRARCTGYDEANGNITFTTMPAAPASTNTAIIV